MKKEPAVRTLTRNSEVKVYANLRGRRFVKADEVIHTSPAQRVLRQLENLVVPFPAAEAQDPANAKEQ